MKGRISDFNRLHHIRDAISDLKGQMDISRFTELRNMVSHEYFRVDYTIVF
jgi:uncharacterized protein with HEPN domain